MPNWLDLLFLVLLGLAAARGYRRGSIIEVCSFAALWLGIYAALRFSEHVAVWLGLGPDRALLAFLITFLGVLVFVRVLAQLLTKLIDLAQMGWANRLAGVGAGLLRSAFMISLAVNVLLAYTDGRIPDQAARSDSAIYGPIQGFAPTLLPVLKETKWIKELIDLFEKEAAEMTGEMTR